MLRQLLDVVACYTAPEHDLFTAHFNFQVANPLAGSLADLPFQALCQERGLKRLHELSSDATANTNRMNEMPKTLATIWV
jgi:hypothetical protein